MSLDSDGELPPDALSYAELLIEREKLVAQVKGLERTVRSQAGTIGKLTIDREFAAQNDEYRDHGVIVFTEWRIATGRMRSIFTPERFFLCKPYIVKEGLLTCRAAVWGIAADPYTRRVTPSYTEVYNDFETVFTKRGNFERFANRGIAIFGKELGILPPSAQAN